MPRIRRMVVKGEDAVYHVMSRTALNGFILGDMEKEHLPGQIKKLSPVYFVEVLGFSIIGTHFRLLVRMKTSKAYSDGDLKDRLAIYHADREREIPPGQIAYFRNKYSYFRVHEGDQS